MTSNVYINVPKRVGQLHVSVLSMNLYTYHSGHAWQKVTQGHTHDLSYLVAYGV